jgi:hypothetical protein
VDSNGTSGTRKANFGCRNEVNIDSRIDEEHTEPKMKTNIYGCAALLLLGTFSLAQQMPMPKTSPLQVQIKAPAQENPNTKIRRASKRAVQKPHPALKTPHLLCA